MVRKLAESHSHSDFILDKAMSEISERVLLMKTPSPVYHISIILAQPTTIGDQKHNHHTLETKNRLKRANQTLSLLRTFRIQTTLLTLRQAFVHSSDEVTTGPKTIATNGNKTILRCSGRNAGPIKLYGQRMVIDVIDQIP